VQSCNYHARAIRHIHRLLTLDLAQTLACSLIFSTIDYCNSVLLGSPSSTIQKLQRVQNNAARIVLQAPRRSDVNSLLQTLHWLPVELRINYKSAVLTFKTQQTSSPQYLNQHISLRTSARNTRSSSVPLLCVPFRRTSFARQSFSTAAPLTWNSLPPAVLNCDSLLSNPDLKLFCFLPLSANYSTYLFRQCLSASEMTYIVSSGALNSTHSLTRQCLCCRLTALWCYINFVLLLLLITIIVIIKQQFVRQSNMARVTTRCRWKRQNIHSLRCSVADTDAVDYTV